MINSFLITGNEGPAEIVRPVKRDSGFTLIELVMVIIILGVLSAVALPKYIDLQGEAKAAVANGIMGASASACAINYSARKIKANPPSAITSCNLLNSAIDAVDVAITDDGSGQCAITIGSSVFALSLSSETDTAPCKVDKISGMWPKG